MNTCIVYCYKATCLICNCLHDAKSFMELIDIYIYVIVFSFWIDCDHLDAPAGKRSRSLAYNF